MTTAAEQLTRRAESVRQMDLREAVCRTAMRYPHLSVQAIARLFGVFQADVASALGAARLDRPRRNAGDVFCAESVREDAGVGLSVAAMVRKYDRPRSEIEALMAREGIPAPVIRREIPKEEEKTVPIVTGDELPQAAVASVAAEPARRRRRRPDELPTKEQVAAVLDLPIRDAALTLGVAQSTYKRLRVRYGFAPEPRKRQKAEPEQPTVEKPIRDLLDDPAVAEETLIRCLRRGLSGEEVARLLERYARVPAEQYRYDLQLTVREVHPQ